MGTILSAWANIICFLRLGDFLPSRDTKKKNFFSRQKSPRCSFGGGAACARENYIVPASNREGKKEIRRPLLPTQSDAAEQQGGHIMYAVARLWVTRTNLTMDNIEPSTNTRKSVDQSKNTGKNRVTTNKK